MKIRARGIIEYKNEPHIIIQFDHKNYEVELARWLHPIELDFIRNIMPLPSEIKIPIEEMEKCKILFV